MIEWPILSVLIFLPLVGSLFILSVRGEQEIVAANARAVALWASLITFAISLLLWIKFDRTTAEFQFIEHREWISSFGISYFLGVDGISLLFVILTSVLTLICILASWESITVRVKEYMIAFLVMETMMIGVFCALDTVLFYIFFEGLLIPMFLIIGIWGGPQRVYAAFKFFLYTLTGSVFFLIALLAMYFEAGTTSIPELMSASFAPKMQLWLWLALFASFAVKVPMWPLHTWLPDAHVEAPTAGSVILAGVLLKLGGYAFIRFSLPMLPDASAYFTPLIYGLSIIAVIYTSLVALMQEDMKKLIAYSSVAHMGFVTIGLFTLTTQGVEGGLVIMLSHGLISSALFLCVGVVYDRMQSRLIGTYGGLVHRMPVYALVFMVFTLASIGLPGTSGFVGELLVLVGAYQVATWVAALAATGVVLGAAYMLWLYRRVIFGTIENEALKSILDLNRREILMFAPIIVGVLWLGVYPNSFLDVMHVSVENLIALSQPSEMGQTLLIVK
ncbi:MAG: NADH-quinone oxidoreductase subunit M [Alphaproteobacteria bacterium]|nr:NADH-quinone oxidoreductase subunit M [Alphaproteobacteria bacterium]HIO02820.1 NADH-quinone oxidoreductase subunit M [Alphaproteobacteria bacterium]